MSFNKHLKMFELRSKMKTLTRVKVFNEDLPLKRSKMKTLIKSLLKFTRKLRSKMKTLIRFKTKTQFNKQPSGKI